MNFDPSMWTDKDLDELIKLWTEFEEVAKSCRLVISKIETASIKNDSFKSEIQASTERCNEITKDKSSVSIDSAGEMIHLSENIKDIRAQEDAIEKEIAKYRDELVSLRTKKDNIMSKIDKLNFKVQKRSLNEKSNIKGNIEVKEILNLQDKEKIKVNSKNSIISTKKTAVVILKSTYSESIGKSINLPQIVIDKINNSGLVKNTENMTEEMIKSRDELDERMKNYLASIEASNLAKQTEKEIISNETSISMSFIGEDKPELSEDEQNQNIEEDKEILTSDNKSDELKPEENNSDLNTGNDKVIPMNPFDTNNINKGTEENDSKENITLETFTPLDSKQEENNVINSIPDPNIPTSTPINLNTDSSNNNLTDKVEKLDLNIPLENKPKQENTNLGEKVDSKKGIIANAKPERISVITSVFSKKYDGNGVKSVDTGFSVNSKLESVQKFLQFDQNKLGVTKENTSEESVSNIFDSQKEEVQPLKLAA